MSGAWRKFTGVAKKTDEAMNLATAMAVAKKEGKPVEWTVHENGAAVFGGALRVLKQEGVKLEGSQSVFLVNSTTNLFGIDRYRRAVGMEYSAKGSHHTKVTSIRQAYLGGNLLANIYMARYTQGNTFDKLEAGGVATVKAAGSLAMYTMVSLSAFLTASNGQLTVVGGLEMPKEVSINDAGAVGTAAARYLTAMGYVAWATTVSGAIGLLANVSRRMDRNVTNPYKSLLGRQLGTPT